MSGTAFIYDGYTDVFDLDAVEGIHEAIRIEARPMTAEQISRLSTVTERETGENQRRRIAEMIKPHIVSWDLKDRGTPVELNVDNILRVRQQVYHWMFQCVCGNVKATVKDAKNSPTV